MYIKNKNISGKVFECDKAMASYLIYTCHLPVLSIKEKIYFFADTLELKNGVDNAPFFIKIFHKGRFIDKGGQWKEKR